MEFLGMTSPRISQRIFGSLVKENEDSDLNVKVERLSQDVDDLKALLRDVLKPKSLLGAEEDYRQHYTTFVANTLDDIADIRDQLKKKLGYNYIDPDDKLNAAAKKRRVYCTFHRSLPVNSNTVLWEAHSGVGMVCSPAALFEYVIKQLEYSHLDHIWVITDDTKRAQMETCYRFQRNVSFIKGSSEAYLQAMATSGYIIGNVSLPSFFSKRDGQIVVNNWHSVTAKTLGFDQPNGTVETRNVLRSFLATDYLVSPNPFMTSLYKRAFKLPDVFQGEILETGFPRVDYLFNTNREEMIQDLENRGVTIDPTKKLVLFAPTWRGERVGTAQADHKGFSLMMRSAKKRLDPEKYQILVKPHNLTYQAMVKAGAKTEGLVPPDVDANKLLSIVDVLISDYSSIFFDFLPTKRPVLFYTPDIKEYTAQRGVMFEQGDLPGPFTKSAAQICEWINDECRIMDEYKDNYDANLKLANPLDDGNASSRVAKAVFSTQQKPPRKPEKTTKKKRIMFYGGAFHMNGVTTTLIALLKMLDYSKVDATLYVPAPASKIQNKLLSWVPNDVRIMVRLDTYPSTREEERKVEKFLVGDLPETAYSDPDLQHVFAREYRRCFGNAVFDYVIDYSGYSMFWPAVFIQSPNAKCFVWQHNELSRDFGNQAKRGLTAAKKGLPSLQAMSGMYRFVDKVVACGEKVTELNKAAMAMPATEDKFCFVPNIIDFDRVTLGCKNRYCFPALTWDRYTANKATDKVRSVERIDSEQGPRGAGYFYGDVSPSNKSGWKAKNANIPLPQKDHCNFVSMGRFSSEKNHEALIRAFSAFCMEHPDSRLYLIGDGALRSSYETLIDELELQDRVHLTGALKNPFGLASLCDCFVLPSLYEGMPIAPLEARIMGLPLIMAAFGSVDSVSVKGGQLIVDPSDQGLLEGLQAFKAGKVPKPVSFDPDKYNSRGLKAFYKLIGLEP